MTDKPTDYQAVKIGREPVGPNYWGVARDAHLYLDREEAEELAEFLNNLGKKS